MRYLTIHMQDMRKLTLFCCTQNHTTKRKRQPTSSPKPTPCSLSTFSSNHYLYSSVILMQRSLVDKTTHMVLHQSMAHHHRGRFMKMYTSELDWRCLCPWLKPKTQNLANVEPIASQNAKTPLLATIRLTVLSLWYWCLVNSYSFWPCPIIKQSSGSRDGLHSKVWSLKKYYFLFIL